VISILIKFPTPPKPTPAAEFAAGDFFLRHEIPGKGVVISIELWKRFYQTEISEYPI